MENNQLDVEGRKVIIRIWIEYSWEWNDFLMQFAQLRRSQGW